MSWNNNDGGWKGGNQNPWGSGGGGGSGRGPQPPDLDEMIRKGQERLKNIVPGGRGGIFILLLVAVGLWLLSGFYSVQPSQQGVVLRFGEWVRTETPGLNWHLPYPIETVILPNVTLENRIDIGFRSDMEGRSGSRQARVLEESLMLTGDENIVDIAFTVFWRINDAGQFLFNIEAPQEATIKSVSESVMRDILGRTPIQSALTEGRGAIETEAQIIIQQVLDGYETGVAVTSVRLERADPPAQVIDAFRDVQAAQADRERFRNQAEAYAFSIIPEARGRANQLVQEAEAYKQQVIEGATGEASRFLNVLREYSQAEDVTRKRIYLETMENILANMNKIIVDDGAGTGVVPYLPLPELQNRRNDQGGNE